MKSCVVQVRSKSIPGAALKALPNGFVVAGCLGL